MAPGIGEPADRHARVVTLATGDARYCLNVTVRKDRIWTTMQHPSLFSIEEEEADELTGQSA